MSSYPEVQAACETVVWRDRADWTLLQLTGADCRTFLHNQSTNQINLLQPGQGCETVFVNSTGRTIDLATVHLLTPEKIWVLASPGQDASLLAWLDRYLFPMDRVKLQNLTGTQGILTLIGPKSAEILQNLGLTPPEGAIGAHCSTHLAETPILISRDSGVALPGYTLFYPPDTAATVQAAIATQDVPQLSDPAGEVLRIQQGRPFPGSELTTDYNALEAGLWRAISFTKGCYIGQETIARLNTYQGVKQRLWGISLSATVEPGREITIDGQTVGTLTSVSPLFGATEGAIALGYVKTKAGGLGATVQVGAASGAIVATPYLRHEYYQVAQRQ